MFIEGPKPCVETIQLEVRPVAGFTVCSVQTIACVQDLGFGKFFARMYFADEADMDGIPGVSMLEAFNYATSRDQHWCGNYNDPTDPNDPPDCEEPVYDNNSDGEGSAYDQINSGISQDGIFGSSVYLK